MEQLTGVDTSFLTMEGPTTVGHITGVLVIDPSTSPEPWTFERYRRHLLSRIDNLKPLTRRIVEVPFGLDRPYWADATDFDIDYHLRHVAVPGDGSRDAVAELVSRIHSRPLDRQKPLWESYVVEGLQDGRIGILTKIHHAAIDGISGVELLQTLVDLDPEVPVPEDPPPFQPGDLTSPDDVLQRALMTLALSPVRMARAAIALGKTLPVLGDLLTAAGPTSTGSESTMDLISSPRLSAPSTPFNKAIGPHRRWAYASVPLDEVKAVKNAVGLTVNDVVLGIVGGVLRRWLEENGGIPERPLAAMVPLSVRKEGQENAVGNFVSGTVATLATHLDDPIARLEAVHDGMRVAKESHNAIPADMLTDLTQVAPPAVSALAARLIASTKLADRVGLPFNVVVSNVPGPPIPLYLAGAKIEANFPVSAIVDGVGLNITVQSTNGMLDFGFVSDRDQVPDLWTMADSVAVELADLMVATGVTEARKPAKKKAAAKKARPKKKPAQKKAAAKKARPKKKPAQKKPAQKK